MHTTITRHTDVPRAALAWTASSAVTRTSGSTTERPAPPPDTVPTRSPAERPLEPPQPDVVPGSPAEIPMPTPAPDIVSPSGPVEVPGQPA